MKVVIKTATEARNEFFKLINAAFYGGTVTVVKKSGEEVARIIPAKSKNFDWDAYVKDVELMGGDLADYAEDGKRKKARKAWKERIEKRK